MPTYSKPTDTRQGFSIVLYGPPLVGKTSTLIDPNWKVCLIDLDQNSTPLQDAENVTVVSCETFEDYLSVKADAERGYRIEGGKKVRMDFDLYVVDSFTKLEAYIKDWVVRSYAPNRRREISSKFGAQSDWQDLQDQEIEEVRDWQTYTKRKDKPLNVLWIGHDMTVYDGMGAPTSMQIALQGRYASLRIMAAVDAVFYMFKSTKKDFYAALRKDTSKLENPNEVVRGVYTVDQGIIKSEARVSPTRRKELKPFIFNIVWSEIYEMIGYKNAAPQPKMTLDDTDN